jgi:hypothetical protein
MARTMGTTYAANLKETAYLKNSVNLPPMPWYQVRAMNEGDLRSLYRYVKSLGKGDYRPPFYKTSKKEPRTPFILLKPPQAPKNPMKPKTP